MESKGVSLVAMNPGRLGRNGLNGVNGVDAGGGGRAKKGIHDGTVNKRLRRRLNADKACMQACGWDWQVWMAAWRGEVTWWDEGFGVGLDAPALLLFFSSWFLSGMSWAFFGGLFLVSERFWQSRGLPWAIDSARRISEPRI